MSLPAREAERWATPTPHQPVRRRAVSPARAPATRPPVPNPPHPHPHRRTRRGHHTAFWVFTAVVVSSLVVGLVSVNAMRVDAAYRGRSVSAQVRALSDEQRTLVNDVARLSSPSRIGRWARLQGLVHPAPGDVVILQVPGASGQTGASEPTASSDETAVSDPVAASTPPSPAEVGG
jgi:cell division protein FtsL